MKKIECLLWLWMLLWMLAGSLFVLLVRHIIGM